MSTKITSSWRFLPNTFTCSLCGEVASRDNMVLQHSSLFNQEKTGLFFICREPSPCLHRFLKTKQEKRKLKKKKHKKINN